MASMQQAMFSVSIIPIAFVHANQDTTADGSAGLTVSAGSRTNGNTVYAALSYDKTAALTGNVTFGGQDMSLVGQNQDAGGNLTMELWRRYLDGTESDNNCVMTTTSAVRANLTVIEYSGLPNATAESTETNNQNTTSTMLMVTAALAPTSTNNLIIAIGGYFDATNRYSSGPTNGFTRLTPVGGADIRQEVIYLIRSASNASISSDITLLASYSWCSVSAAFGGN